MLSVSCFCLQSLPKSKAAFRWPRQNDEFCTMRATHVSASKISCTRAGVFMLLGGPSAKGRLAARGLVPN